MKPEDKVLQPEQVQQLEAMGVKFGETERIHCLIDGEWSLEYKSYRKNGEVDRYIPAPDMQELLPALPKNITFTVDNNNYSYETGLSFLFDDDECCVDYCDEDRGTIHDFWSNNLLLAVYGMLLYLIKNNYTTVKEVNARLRDAH